MKGKVDVCVTSPGEQEARHIARQCAAARIRMSEDSFTEAHRSEDLSAYHPMIELVGVICNDALATNIWQYL